MSSRRPVVIRDETVRLIVMANPVPERLIVALANASDIPPALIRRHADRSQRMTPALWETLKLAAAGHSTKRIAGELGISYGAAQDRMKRLLAYLGARDRMEIVTRCYREGII